MAAFCRKPLRKNRIPNAAGATGRVARSVQYGGNNGKPWRGALFHRARRTKLGDDGNLMLADGNSFPVFILEWTIETIYQTLLGSILSWTPDFEKGRD